MAKQLVVTEEGLKSLKAELEELKTNKRKEVTEAIRVALSFGDLSENSEYDEAKNEQAKVEARIFEIEEQLKTVKVIDTRDVKTDVVGVGSVVKVHDETLDSDDEYTIVGTTEADPMAGKISDQSPIGMALLSSRIGQKVVAHTPGGDIPLTVLDIKKADS